MDNPSATRSSGAVTYWKVSDVNAETISTLPDWVQGKLHAGNIFLTSKLNMVTFKNDITAHYKTVLGTKQCEEGDYIILDHGEMYHLSEDSFNRLFSIVKED